MSSDTATGPLALLIICATAYSKCIQQYFPYNCNSCTGHCRNSVQILLWRPT